MGPYAYAQAAYEFVRDAIPHSADSGNPRVTWSASDVIEQRTGICHAKSNEADCPVLYAVPHPAVLSVLKAAPDRPTLWKTLPTAL
ncbi:hypothetical protein GCM10022206_90140 [Streptomyces chiangmaiensis]